MLETTKTVMEIVAVLTKNEKFNKINKNYIPIIGSWVFTSIVSIVHLQLSMGKWDPSFLAYIYIYIPHLYFSYHS